MTEINKLLNTLNRMLDVASSMRLHTKASTMHYKIIGIENNQVEIKIENWNNNYYIIDLGNNSSIIKMYRAELKEYRAYTNYCKLLNKARKNNSILFKGELVKVVNESVKDNVFHRGNAVYKLNFSDGSTSNWFGFNAEKALSNAAPYLNRIPESIEFNQKESE